MAHIIDGIYRVAVPETLPEMACELRDGAIVRAWVGHADAPEMTWRAFNTLPIRPEGTDFQMRIWRALCAVPFGQVVSYGELARMASMERAARAAGRAVGANPILWRIPCHRVVRADGGLGGFRWGGAAKRALLKYEKSLIL